MLVSVLVSMEPARKRKHSPVWEHFGLISANKVCVYSFTLVYYGSLFYPKQGIIVFLLVYTFFL